MIKPWIIETLGKFAQSIGIDNFQLPDNNVVCFHFERSGRLFIEFNDETVILYLANQIGVENTSLLEKALYACHYKEPLPCLVNVGLRGEDMLIFLVKIPLSEFNLPSLEKALSMLIQLYNNIKQE